MTGGRKCHLLLMPPSTMPTYKEIELYFSPFNFATSVVRCLYFVVSGAKGSAIHISRVLEMFRLALIGLAVLSAGVGKSEGGK